MEESAKQKAINFLHGRKIAYVHSFTGKAGEGVMEDLETFCRGTSSCFNPDPRIHAVLEGRREVWLRIQEHLKLSPEQLWEKYGRKDE